MIRSRLSVFMTLYMILTQARRREKCIKGHRIHMNACSLCRKTYIMENHQMVPSMHPTMKSQSNQATSNQTPSDGVKSHQPKVKASQTLSSKGSKSNSTGASHLTETPIHNPPPSSSLHETEASSITTDIPSDSESKRRVWRCCTCQTVNVVQTRPVHCRLCSHVRTNCTACLEYDQTV